MKFQWSFVVLPYGALWCRRRKLMHTHVDQGVVNRYYPIMTTLARRFARDILIAQHEGHVLTQAVRLNFAQMIVKAVYGIHVESYESEYISLPEKVMENASEVVTPGRFWVDFLPIR
jgi:cytochrome P450